MNMSYNIKDVCKYLVNIILLSAAMKFTDGAGFILLVPFVLAALFRKNVNLLVICMLVANATLVVNSFFMPKGFAYGVTHRALLGLVGACGALLFLSMGRSKLVSPVMGMLVYLFYMIIPSATGWQPMISYLKLALFLSVFMALAYTAKAAIKDSRLNMIKVRSMILALAIFFLLGSLLLFPFPSISYMNAIEALKRGEELTSLYMGICNHSQTLGMVMAFWVIFLFADLIFHVQRLDKLYILLILCGCFLLYKSSGRTAMGTMLACVIIASFFFVNMRGRIRTDWKRKMGNVLVVLGVLAVVLTLAVPQIRDGVVKFAMKYNKEATSKDFNMEYAVSTRQGLVEDQLYNFKKRPATGWGFQVSEQVAELSKETKGLILSAPVEKGVWVTAILEEGGVIGEIIYVIFFVTAAILLVARKAYMGFIIFMALHISNLGEMTMFSMSGCGGLWYTFLFIALIFDAKRIQGARAPRYAYDQWGGYLR